MEKTTVLARLRLDVSFNTRAIRWLSALSDEWFAEEDGDPFLVEFGHTWERIFVESVEPGVQSYFAELGIGEEYLPRLQIGEHYRGSWILEAAVVMAATVGTTYHVLKAVSDLPDIAEGLGKLKMSLLKRLRPRVGSAVRKQMIDSLHWSARENPSLESAPQVPKQVVDIDLVIDARPILSLTPAALKSHKVHLSVALSRDSLTLENLGDELLRDVRLGLFRTPTERHQWTYQDSYMGSVPLLSARQTITRQSADFRDRNGSLFDLSDGQPVHVDCWVEDSHGICLFRFFLGAG